MSAAREARVKKAKARAAKVEVAHRDVRVDDRLHGSTVRAVSVEPSNLG